MLNSSSLGTKTMGTAKKGLFIGMGAGLVLFALEGLLPGSFIGGVIGINIAGAIFGLPLTASALPRIIVGASMVVGVMLSGVVFVLGGAALGWLTGNAVEAIGHTTTEISPAIGGMKAQTLRSK